MSEYSFIIKCPKCAWKRLSDGLNDQISDLFEYKDCSKCGKPRTFRCPKCGTKSKMFRTTK